MFNLYCISFLLFYMQDMYLNKVCFQGGRQGCWYAGKLALL